MLVIIYLIFFSDQVQSEDEDEDYRPHWELHWKVDNILIKDFVYFLMLV